MFSAYRSLGFAFLLFIISQGCTSPGDRAILPTGTTPVETESLKQNTEIRVVEIKAMKFVPAEIVVPRGTTIRFINNDIVSHDVTEESTNAWSSKLLSASESWEMTANRSANYYCSIHVIMKGRITVTD